MSKGQRGFQKEPLISCLGDSGYIPEGRTEEVAFEVAHVVWHLFVHLCLSPVDCEILNTRVFVVKVHYLFDSSQQLCRLGTVTGSPFTNKEKALRA